MTIADLILNIAFTAFVLSVVVGLIVWGIRTSRPAAVAPAPAHNPRLRERAPSAHAAHARAAHADRARAARSSRSLGAAGA